jgi:hypothetical protein
MTIQALSKFAGSALIRDKFDNFIVHAALAVRADARYNLLGYREKMADALGLEPRTR